MTSIWLIDPGLGMHPGDYTAIAKGAAEPLKLPEGATIADQAAEIVRQYEAMPTAERPAEILVDIATLGSAMYHELMQAGLPVAAYRIVARSPAYRAGAA